jgi:cytochrome b involved in lipid metabolism
MSGKKFSLSDSVCTTSDSDTFVSFTTNDGEEYELPTHVTQQSVVLSELCVSQVNAVTIDVDVDSETLDNIVRFLEVGQRIDFVYDPRLIREYISAARALQVPKMLSFFESELSRLAKCRKRTISYTEFCSHQSDTDFWILIDGGVYDVTPYVAHPKDGVMAHPGGTAIFQGCKGDSTYFFEINHRGTSTYTLLQKYFIGVMSAEEVPVSHEELPGGDFLYQLRSVTRHWRDPAGVEGLSSDT